MKICYSYRCAVAQHHCSAILLLAKRTCPLLSAAVQNRQPAGLCHCKNTCQDLFLNIGVQWPDTNAVQHLTNCNSHCSTLLCKPGSQQSCATSNTPMEICSSYICAVAQKNAVPQCFDKIQCSLLMAVVFAYECKQALCAVRSQVSSLVCKGALQPGSINFQLLLGHCSKWHAAR